MDECLNCGVLACNHYGWACAYSGVSSPSPHDALGNFSRFYNKNMGPQPMPHSLVAQAAGAVQFLRHQPADAYEVRFVTEVPPEPMRIKSTEPDTDHWRAWAHNVPGDCACGIKKEQCEYHK